MEKDVCNDLKRQLTFIFYKELQINKKKTGNLIENGQRVCIVNS